MGTHSANCAADRRDSSGSALGPVLDMPVIVQRRCAVRGRQGRRHLCHGADADSFGPSIQKLMEILQLQFIDKVVDVCCAGAKVFAWTLSLHMPLVVQRQLPGGSDGSKLRRSRSCSPS